MSKDELFEKVAWKESYASGLVYLDNHRRNFLDIINELVEVVNQDTCESMLPMIFHRLAFYVEDYFVRKEMALSGDMNLPIKTYKAEHDRFTREIHRYHEEFTKGNKMVCRSMLEFLISWFENYCKVFGPEGIEYMRKKGFQ